MEIGGIVLCWFLFGASHMAFSSLKLRPKLVGVLGDQGFQGIYTLVALGTFVPLVWIYSDAKHMGPLLWHAGTLPAVRWLGYGLMGVAFVLVMGGAVKPSPFSAFPGKGEVVGIYRITRHPVFMGIGLFGLTHLLMANIFVSDFVFFVGFPVFALLGCWHQDVRKLADGKEEFQQFHAATPFVPFSGGAALQGLREMPLPIALGVGVTLAIRWFHSSLFSGS